MNRKNLIPSCVSSTRLIALPIFIVLFNLGNIWACLIVLAFCAASDYFDGYLARKLHVTSKAGAYYDSAIDFTFTAGIFAFFTLKGMYPTWLVLLMALSFAQFIVSSHYAKKLYDPVGKFLGSALYIGIVLTLLLPIQPIFDFVQYAFVGFLLFSFTGRALSFANILNKK